MRCQYYGLHADLKTMALVIAALAVAAGLLAIVDLRRRQMLPVRRVLGVRLTIGLLAVVILVAAPLLISRNSGVADRDLTSIGAYALLYGLPWAFGILGCAVLSPALSRVSLSAVAALALLTLIGPPMATIVDFRNDRIAGLACLVVTGAALVVAGRRTAAGVN